MEPALVEFIKVVKDPLLIVLSIVIFGLFYLLLAKEKGCKEMIASIAGCTAGLAAVNVTLGRLATFIEAMFYKGGGK